MNTQKTFKICPQTNILLHVIFFNELMFYLCTHVKNISIFKSCRSIPYLSD